ncbi:hypothetical protein GCM10008931_43440 [Oceanobacillus oncorhynchi subsp. oncorhynchi]|uniref:hypothetical protein n=1 Tax=Oceanobacillus oncorhynchi TaxID=545501 RepID=UPI0031D3CD6E
MKERKFEVIKDIEEGWETTAIIGDILAIQSWGGFLTLMKDNKAVCDLGSEYGSTHCVKI